MKFKLFQVFQKANSGIYMTIFSKCFLENELWLLLSLEHFLFCACVSAVLAVWVLGHVSIFIFSCLWLIEVFKVMHFFPYYVFNYFLGLLIYNILTSVTPCSIYNGFHFILDQSITCECFQIFIALFHWIHFHILTYI